MHPTWILTIIIILALSGGCVKKENTDAPILVLADRENYGLYTCELLNTEGFHEYRVLSPGDKNLTRNVFKTSDVVILTSGRVDERLEKMLSAYVSGGGKLVLFRPDTALEKIAGVSHEGSKISDGYFRVNPESVAGSGFKTITLQFHGEADGYSLNGAEEVARLFSPDQHDTGFPAVTIYSLGKGRVACFMFNLPQSVVYLHQGNPEWKNQERDGVLGLRNLDLFAGTGSENNWIDANRVAIPQADEQVRLFSRIVEDMTVDKKPLPRLWYFSGLDKCIALLTCDGENNGDPDFYQKEIQSELDVVNSGGGHMTVYLIGTGMLPEVVNAWKSKGNDIGILYDDTRNATRVTRENMDSTYAVMQSNFRENYGTDFPLSNTARNHWIVWYGWSEQAEIELEHGIRLDCNSYKYDNSPDVLRPDWIGGFGYFTGSGIPMKFADENGNILDIYQSETAIVDEQLNTKGGIFNGYRTLVDRSLNEESYAVVNAVFHPNSNSNKPYLQELQKTVDYCRNNHVPMWSGRELVEFLQARDSVNFNDITWNGSQLDFKIRAPVNPGKNFSFIIPGQFAGKKVSTVAIDGISTEFTRRMIKGREYVMVVFRPGKDLSISATYL